MLKKILTILVMLCATLAMAAVDVNKATDAQLDGIKGIGPVTTRLIMTERKKGEFKSWQDFIDRVKGVGEKSAVKLSENGLTVNGESFKGAAMKTEKKETKAAAKEEKKEVKTDVKADKKETRAEMKAEKKAEKQAKADAKATAARPAASAASAARK